MIRRRKASTLLPVAGLSVVLLTTSALAADIQGPSSSDPPYLTRTTPGVVVKSVLTVGDTPTGSTYRMVGIPDGLGAYDNGDGTFTVLMNHELGATAGTVRAHGSKGAFVSKWVIDKSTLEVRSGEDLVRQVYLADGDPEPDVTAFGRLCSADLAPVSAYYNPASGKGYPAGRLFTNGEEVGAEGRAFAHVASGPDAGTSFELPGMGNYSFENVLANPATGDATVVVGIDDSTPGQVYVYVGQKGTTGSPADRAGLTGGRLFGVRAPFATEDATVSIPDNQTFALSAADLGDVSGLSGVQLEALSTAQGVTQWARPEDGAWDPNSPRDFYFVTTGSFTAHSRLWRLRFTDPANPAAGGEITMLLEGPAAGSAGPRMMDNLTVNDRGQVIIQEDPGNQPYLAGVYQYDIAADAVRLVARHDPDRFVAGGSAFMTQDEESSGVIPLAAILGEGWYLLDSQVHKAHPDPELVEYGQLLVLHIPPGQKVR